MVRVGFGRRHLLLQRGHASSDNRVTYRFTRRDVLGTSPNPAQHVMAKPLMSHEGLALSRREQGFKSPRGRQHLAEIPNLKRFT